MKPLNQNKMTAVEWLYDQIKNGFNYNRLEINGYENQRDRLVEQAKEMDKEQKIALGKRCFYKGFEKAESDDANCFTAWREEAEDLLTFKSE